MKLIHTAVLWVVMGVATPVGLLADETPAPPGPATDQQLMDKVKQLEQRVAELEGKGAPPAAPANVSMPQKTLDFLGQTEISGFVSASYLFNFSDPDNSTVAGRGFDGRNNTFNLNKFKLMLENPVDASGEKWDAGFRADLIFGQDAGLIQSFNAGGPGTFNIGSNGDLEQVFVQFNVPIGNGLIVKAGKMVTLMGVEVIEEVANPNWSVGNQFLYVENFTQTGLLLSYKWNDKIDTQLAVFNGWDQLADNNRDKSFMGRIGLTIDDKTSVAVLGYGGPEQTSNNHSKRYGAEIVGNRKLADKFNSYIQLDYGNEEDLVGAKSDWEAAGLWLTYDFTEHVGLALRGDYLRDKDGVRAVPAYIVFVVPPKELTSLTLTLNAKPVANLQIRPEIRWDHSSAETALNGHQDQFTAGVGVAYLY